MNLPSGPRLFLVDGYALIYRAFFALISRPLTTSRGENTSAAWGIVNFLNRMLEQHKPEYVGWVHDSGLSFRHEQYPAYKATREKLSDELQDDFDRGMERICQLLEAYRINILALPGYEADDVIGTLAKQGIEQKVNVVVVSGDKDFQQLVRPGVWLLNPGRGGAAAVEEQWVGPDNASERLGVPPNRVTDYLALVGDSSDNVPGVKGIGDKTARELVETYGDLEAIIAAGPSLSKKRPREALAAHEAEARLSKQLVTIREDLAVPLDLDALKVVTPDHARLKELFVELEFHGLAKEHLALAASSGAAGTAIGSAPPSDAMINGEAPPGLEGPPTNYETVDTVERMREVIARARTMPFIAVDTETVIDPDSPQKVDPLRSTLVSISMAFGPGEAYYFPLRHRQHSPAQGELLGDMFGDATADAQLIVDVAGDRSPTDASKDRGLVRGGDDPMDEIAAAAAKKKPAKKRKSAASAEPGSIAARALVDGRRYPVRNLPSMDTPEMSPLLELLEDASVAKTAQSAKYDILAFRRAGIALRGLDFDTMLASYVLDPGRRSHGLDVLALEFLDHTMTSYEDLCGKGNKVISFDECPVDCARDYSCEEADMAYQLRAHFEPQLETYGLTRLFREIEMPLVDVLSELEWVGISINRAWFASLKERFQKEREAAEQAIYKEAGLEFNINSNLKLREILFDQLKLPVLKRTPTGPSTDASVLNELAEAGHALPSLLMEYRELAKLESTYLDALPALVNPNTGRLHTSFNQTVASTGRLSSSDPNLQNIPIRRELGRDIRRGFVPQQGWWLISADYSQIELRLLAHLSNDPAFVCAFHAGGDIHRQTAAIIFNVPLDQVTSEMRGRAKTINFATIYGQGAHALSRQLRIEHAEAKQFISGYFERFKGIRGYLDSQVEYAREHGYVQTIFGRRRYIPELRDRNFNVRAFGERTATNSPIQGSAADLIKIAMIRIDTALRARFDTRMLLQVHDELVFEAPPEELDEVRVMIKQEMEGAAELSVPLVVDMGVGANWVDTKS